MTDERPTRPFDALRGQLQEAVRVELPASIERLDWDTATRSVIRRSIAPGWRDSTSIASSPRIWRDCR